MELKFELSENMVELMKQAGKILLPGIEIDELAMKLFNAFFENFLMSLKKQLLHNLFYCSKCNAEFCFPVKMELKYCPKCKCRLIAKNYDSEIN